MPSKYHGLRLDLPGAPNTPHWIPEVSGLYRPDDPTPVGPDEQIDLEEAKRLSEDKSIHLKLVEIKPQDVDRLREQATADRNEHRQGARSALGHAEGDETQRVKDGLQAVKETQ